MDIARYTVYMEVINIWKELFHNNIAYHIMSYIGPHPLADIIRPHINNGITSFNDITYDYCNYHLSRHNEDASSSQYLNRNVIETQ